MSTRKQCTNVSTATYSGKEQSPLHFGLSAEGYDVNTILEGYDKMMWSVKIKNNKKVWVRQVPINNQRMLYEEPVIPEVSESSKVDVINNKNNEIPVEEEKDLVSIVSTKKITDYNMFLTYKLHELKKDNNTKTNKELFNLAINEWKELKKTPNELKQLLDKIKTSPKPQSQPKKKSS